jgi:hypothetical protein
MYKSNPGRILCSGNDQHLQRLAWSPDFTDNIDMLDLRSIIITVYAGLIGLHKNSLFRFQQPGI